MISMGLNYECLIEKWACLFICYWLLQQASAVLLDAGVCDDVPPWQHGSIIRAFLCQGHERLALKYMKVKTVPALTADDVKLRMTVLLANG